AAVTQPVIVDAQPASGQALPHVRHVRRATGFTPERHTELRELDAVQIQASPVDEADHNGRVRTLGVPHPRNSSKGLRGFRRRAPTGGDEYDTRRYLAMAPDIACDFHSLDVRMLSNHRDQLRGFDKRVVMQAERSLVAQKRDALENPLRGLGAEPRQRGESAVARCSLQLLQRLEAKAIMYFADLVRA